MFMDTQIEHQSASLNLPLELREAIYTFHFAQTCQDSDQKNPTEPPLTQTSKQLRHESLPIYYSTYTLPIQTYIRCSYHGQIWLRTEPWYHEIPPAKLKWIRHLMFKFALIDRYTGQRVPIEFYVDLARSGREFAIRHSFARSWFRDPHRISDPADFEDLIDVLRSHLVETLQDLVRQSDESTGILTVEGIDRLVKIDPDSLPL